MMPPPRGGAMFSETTGGLIAKPGACTRRWSMLPHATPEDGPRAVMVRVSVSDSLSLSTGLGTTRDKPRQAETAPRLSAGVVGGDRRAGSRSRADKAPG